MDDVKIPQRRRSLKSIAALAAGVIAASSIFVGGADARALVVPHETRAVSQGVDASGNIVVAQRRDRNWRNGNRNGGRNMNRNRNRNRGNRGNGRRHRNNGFNGNVGAGVAAGVAAGIIGGIIAESQRRHAPPPPADYGYDAHVEWCLDRYRSYDPRTDTYISHRHGERRCRSPYN